MKDSLIAKIDNLLDRYDELAALLSDQDIISDQNLFRNYSKEYSELEPLIVCFRKYESKKTDLEEAQSLQKDPDKEIQEMAAEEAENLSTEIDAPSTAGVADT